MSVYEKMKFPDYKFREYPKVITAPNGERREVKSQIEELGVIATVPLTHSEDPQIEENNALAVELAQTQAEAQKLREELAELKAGIQAQFAMRNSVSEVDIPKEPPKPAPTKADPYEDETPSVKKGK